MACANYQVNVTLSQSAAEEALRGYAAGRSGFDYGMARDLELLINALRAAHDEAKSANQAKSAFLACVSHELRTPLNAIIGFAEMIAGEQLGPMPEKRYADYAEDIVNGARRLSHILTDIIDMARLESGRLEMQRDTFIFSDLIDEVTAILLQRAAPGSARLRKIIAPDFPQMIWTDKSRLRQILVNLLSNALAYTPTDGVVTLSAALAPGGDSEIKIADSGQGMSPSDLKRAVTRFGHVEDEASRARPGIGLGLPLAKGLTELLGGKMQIESKPGKGTTITIQFSWPANGTPAHDWGKPPDRVAVRAQRLLRTQPPTLA